ncbi:T-lymphocyte activation antigen CD80 isoform X2 [Puntigrus tetrazona]|uniref:T-lymphocyte activation antigen CD80 isoform X2 n=1 Tax=Puntigrus tetrazona TaxID=1606681 RepID=UPI001C8AA765|nr:T-lymphocyte activation antigen CD80 isoform X2 [Puntigrus tetrazona]
MSLQLRCLYVHSLALVVTLLLLSAASGGSDKVKNITAVLGRSVTFSCALNNGDSVEGLYIQRVINDKEEKFINGFYNNPLPMEVPEQYQNRTTVNKTGLSVEMRDISVSDEGLYTCVVFINKDPNIFKILLRVKAEYSVPTITAVCGQRSDGGAGQACQLSCSAAGGYPRSAAGWAELNQSLIKVINNWSSADNESKTWTVNQTIMYTCDQPTNISCAIGGAVSENVTICERNLFSLVVIAAIAVVLVFVLLVIFVVVMKCCCGRQQNPGDPSEEVGMPLANSASER